MRFGTRLRRFLLFPIYLFVGIELHSYFWYISIRLHISLFYQ